jgi:hypothetical protein
LVRFACFFHRNRDLVLTISSLWLSIRLHVQVRMAA